MTERRGGPTISGEGVRMYKDGGGGGKRVRFAVLIFLKYPMKMK